MTQKQRLLTVLMTLMLSVTGAWALDGSGTNSDPYQLGSVQDWKDFAAITNADATGAGAWAVMTADIDLGTDQTNITPTWFGDNSTRHYHGTFDGQGHTLTVHYSGSTAVITPFGCTAGATIKNLHVAGSITSTYSNESHSSGLICNSAGSDVIQNIWVSADIKAAGSGWTECGAFIGCNNCGSSTVTDCLFTGTLTTTGGNYNGCFVGYVHSGSTTTSNCLSTGTFTLAGSPNYVQVGTVNNSYVLQHSVSIPASMQTDATKLSDGTVTTALNAGRTGDDAVWVQQGSQPMLKIFAVKTDASGAYLIGSVDDWKAFADIVNSGTNPAANAKMIADINLGTDQTRIGSTSDSNTALHYQGVFDGQGHKLTVAYVETGNSNLCAPFTKLNNATIKNLHIAGTIQTAGIHGAGIASDSRGTTTIENIWVEASISSTHTGWDEESAFVGCMKAGTLNITDCFFTGTVTGTGSYNGCFVGYIDSGSATFTNCLSTGTFTGSFDFRGTHNNCYVKQFTTAIPTDMQVTDAELADGTTTTALNAGRVNGPWVQDAVSGEPRLDLFMATTSLTAHEGATGEYWSTYYDGVKSCLADANTTVYTGKVNGNKIALTEVTDKTIPAGNAVILKSTTASVTLTKTSATGTLADNDLKGVDVATAKANVYCLNKNGTVVGFYRYTGDVPAHRAYIESISGTRMFSLGDGDATGIVSMEEGRGIKEDGTGEWYSLDGRQLNAQPTRKGIYVKDGKKVVIK